MAARDWIDEVARWHLDQIWAGAPWLGATIPPGTPLPVRHNLDAPLLSQLAERIGGHACSAGGVYARVSNPRQPAPRVLTLSCPPPRHRLFVQSSLSQTDTRL